MREHNDAVNRLDVLTGREPISVDYAPGTVQVVEQHDGSKIALRKIDADYDAHDRVGALAFCKSMPPRARSSPDCSTSIPDAEDLHAHLNTVDNRSTAQAECSAPEWPRWKRSTPVCVEVARSANSTSSPGLSR